MNKVIHLKFVMGWYVKNSAFTIFEFCHISDILCDLLRHIFKKVPNILIGAKLNLSLYLVGNITYQF
jgi:hypothetical protein